MVWSALALLWHLRARAGAPIAVADGGVLQRDETIRTVTLYVDWETFAPLYWISRTDGRRLVEVGILVHRYSDDVEGYPTWPDQMPARVLEPVAASFADVLAGRGGWLRESWELRSTPASESERKRMTTNQSLQQGH